MSAHFLFLESNTTGTGKLAVEHLLATGHRVTFLTRAPEKYPFLGTRHGLRIVETETNDLETVTDQVATIDRQDPAEVLLTFSEYYVLTVAVLAERFGLRYLSSEAARTCRDKHRLRQTLHQAGLRHPWFRLLCSEQEAREAAAEIHYPCVVKPTGESSSKGVRKVGNSDELLAHYQELATWTINDRGQAVDGAVLLEGLLDGPEVSVETLSLADGSVQVLGICRKHLSPPPFFVELGHDFPFEPPEGSTPLLEEVEKVLRAIGYDFGFAHTEVRLTSEGPVVVEVNPRLAGGMIPELVRHATGLDLLTVLLDQLRGLPVDLTPRRREAASIRFLTAPRAGRVTAVEGVDEARALPGVREVEVTKGPGVSVQPAEHALHRMGFVIASGPDSLATADIAARAAARIRIEVTASPRGET